MRIERGAPCIDQPGDQFEPEWAFLVLDARKGPGPSPPVSVVFEVARGRQSARVLVRGGASGTTVSLSAAPADATVRGGLEAIVRVLAGQIGYKETTRRGMLRTSGARNGLAALPELFPPAAQF